VQSLEGKSVLITGGARRIGRAVALAMARAGAAVAITSRTSARDARRTLADLGALGAHALSLPCDLNDPKSVAAAVKTVTREFGGLDILINNAGQFESVAFEKLTLAQWDAVFSANVRGPFLMTQAATTALRRRRGKIINLGSLGGIRPWVTHAHYCSSKAALHMLTRVSAKALAPDIAVNCVAPGMIEMSARPSRAAQKLGAKSPMGRAGTAEDVVEAVMFFATATYFITGQVLVVDGGLELV
jgi:NAD(P)-dependent dehydrogenase (short-subunit alcohol dehydrogenase family)